MDGIRFGHNIAVDVHSGNTESCPFLAGTRAFQHINVEVGKLSIREKEVRGAVGIGVCKVCACPVEHRHEVVAYGVDAFSRKVAKTDFVAFYLLIAVWTRVFNGLCDRQRLHHAPTESVAFDEKTQIVDFLLRPNVAQRHIVKGGHYTLNTYLPQHGQRDFIVLAEPSPSKFHSC